MIRIVSRMVIKLECLDRYYELARELVDETRKEPGCIVYELNQSVSDQRVHCFTEEWQDQAAIDAHNASPHFTRIVPQLGDLFDEPSMLDLYRVKM